MARFTLVQRDTAMSTTRFTRKTVDLTEAQAAALEELIAHAEQTASDATGLEIRIGVRQFFHMLLKKHAQEIGIEWPEDYPQHGGKRT